jgi:ABC-type transport system involved in cytochrome bd biosynthesis fused ATPase/permease subunit
VIRRLVAVGGAPASRLLGALLLGVCAAGFGVALMTSAGYLVSRAAEQPPILSLTIAIVAVRFFGLARPLARYLERLAMHDHALRALGRIRPRFYERIEPLAPTQLEGYRRGELLGRMVDDVDALQGLFARALGPPIVALAVAAGCVGATAFFSPAAAAALAAGLAIGIVVVPAVSALLVRRAAQRQAPGARRAHGGPRRGDARRAGARRLRPPSRSPTAHRAAEPGARAPRPPRRVRGRAR